MVSNVKEIQRGKAGLLTPSINVQDCLSLFVVEGVFVTKLVICKVFVCFSSLLGVRPIGRCQDYRQQKKDKLRKKLGDTLRSSVQQSTSTASRFGDLGELVASFAGMF